MKYLRKVVLKNFQSHKHTVVEFDKGLNIIVGPSDTGKSAIIRGIKWVLYNEPAGDYFIREGESEASVTLEFSNDIKVERLRNSSKNAYILYKQDGEGLTFEGFGSKVPQEIIDLLSIKKIPLDSNESNSINLGEQLEGAFLLSERGSTRASAIGRLIGVNLVDDALKETLRDIRNISITKKNISKNIEDIKEELIGYDYLDDLLKDIKKLEETRNLLKSKIEIKNVLTKASQKYKNTIIEKKEFKEILSRLAKISDLETNIYLIENKNNQLAYYKRLNTNLNETKYNINYNNKLLTKLENIKNIEQSIITINLIKEKLNKLRNLKIQVKTNKNEYENINYIKEQIKDVGYINESIYNIEEKLIRLQSLNALSKSIKSVDKSINIGESYINKLKNINRINLIYMDLGICIKQRNQLLDIYKTLGKVKSEISQQDKILKNNKNNMEKNLKKYENLLKEYEICPFCLSEINKNKIDHIIEHYT